MVCGRTPVGLYQYHHAPADPPLRNQLNTGVSIQMMRSHLSPTAVLSSPHRTRICANGASGLYHGVCRRCLLRKFRQQLEASTRNASLFFCIEMAECHLSRPTRAPGVIFALYYVLGVIFRTTYRPSVIFRRVHGPGVIFRYSATPGVIFGQKGTLCDNF